MVSNSECFALQLIYITRNPRDAAVSYFHFMKLLTACSYQGSLSAFFKMFLSDMGKLMIYICFLFSTFFKVLVAASDITAYYTYYYSSHSIQSAS